MAPFPHVYCRVLGPARVTVDGADAPPELLWRKHLALLVYLARSPRRSRTREHLVGLLWSDRDERQARHSLSEALRLFRRILGDEQVHADVDQIRLGADAVTLDCDRFVESCGRGDWQAAAALVEGDFLEGLAVPGANEFESWLGVERVRWRSHALGAQVGTAPGPDTTRLADRIRDARVGRRVLAAPPAARPRPPLCGRGAELAALAAAWERTKSGRGQVIIVEGEPGEGKSRLIEELLARARLDDATVAAVRAVAVDQKQEWSAVAGLLAAGLADAPGIAGAPPDALAALV